MNVVESGVITILAVAALVAAVVLPVLVADLLRQIATASAVLPALALSDRPMTAAQVGSPVLQDVLPAHRAWRAPPSSLRHFRSQRPGDRPAWG